MELNSVPSQTTVPNCKYCNSNRIVRYGVQKNIQRWWCKDCRRKFIDNNALPRMRTSMDQIAIAISEYYNGSSLNSICKDLQIQYNIYPSESTIYRWVTNFSKIAIIEASKTKINVGENWISSGIQFNIGGKQYCIIDIFDEDTRFLLATRLFYNYSLKDIQYLIEEVEDRAGKKPKQVIMDSWNKDEIENLYLGKHWRDITKDRTQLMCGLKTKETIQLITSGWLVHYNYFRPHESLNYRTPAQAAKSQFNYRSWLDLIVKSSSPTPERSLNNYTAPYMRMAVAIASGLSG